MDYSLSPDTSTNLLAWLKDAVEDMPPVEVDADIDLGELHFRRRPRSKFVVMAGKKGRFMCPGILNGNDISGYSLMARNGKKVYGELSVNGYARILLVLWNDGKGGSLVVASDNTSDALVHAMNLLTLNMDHVMVQRLASDAVRTRFRGCNVLTLVLTAGRGTYKKTSTTVCQNKKTYKSHEQASAKAQKIRMHAYRCNVCKKWHLTSTAPQQVQ